MPAAATSPIPTDDPTITTTMSNLRLDGNQAKEAGTSSSGTSSAPSVGGLPFQRRPSGQTASQSASALRAGVRGGPPAGVEKRPGTAALKLPPSLQAKMAAMTTRSSSSNGSEPVPTLGSLSGSAIPTTSGIGQLSAMGSRTAPPTIGGRRRPAGLTLSAMGMGMGSTEIAASSPRTLAASSGGEPTGSAGRGLGTLGNNANKPTTGPMATPFSNFSKIVDPNGRLSFESKAVIHASGVDFSNGASFSIKMEELELGEELGAGNYGTVRRVKHKNTGVEMALKEIRLELSDSALKTIITELDVLHRASSPYIIDFYGAFFIESFVYYCMEYMDRRSLETFGGLAVDEDILGKVARSMVLGLKFLKTELQIMHRDVKPTNVLLNSKGCVKLCDFGVSGQLDRSIAKTNIGCQSYMAPERIQGESQGTVATYTAASDVWSLGLSLIEFCVGHYPYPPETYSNVFAQLQAIVYGDPPSLPGGEDEPVKEVSSCDCEGCQELLLPRRYSDKARDFVAQCLTKSAERRPSYELLLEHPFLQANFEEDQNMKTWVARVSKYRETHAKVVKKALA